jgi:predicted transcriptional regulator
MVKQQTQPQSDNETTNATTAPAKSDPRVTPRVAELLAANIRRMRTERGLSQEQLAAACGWPQPRLSELEKGKQDRRLGTVEVLASALQTTPESLLRDPADAAIMEELAAVAE